MGGMARGRSGESPLLLRARRRGSGAAVKHAPVILHTHIPTHRATTRPSPTNARHPTRPPPSTDREEAAGQSLGAGQQRAAVGAAARGAGGSWEAADDGRLQAAAGPGMMLWNDVNEPARLRPPPVAHV